MFMVRGHRVLETAETRQTVLEKMRQQLQRLLAIDPHAPMDARANVARNLDAFHEAFGTQPGDGMWLDEADRVRIF